MKLKLVLPDVNQSQFGFTVNDDNAIVYGLGAVKGRGRGASGGHYCRARKRRAVLGLV